METEITNNDIDLRKVFDHARANKYAIGAFNVANLETFKAIVNAAVNKQSPVIIEASASEISYIGAMQMRALADAYILETGLPILLNIDHAIDEEAIKEAIEVGFDLIHVDASTLPYDQNVALTTKVAQWSHERGLICEGELDHIQGSSDDHRDTNVSEVQKKEFYTHPDTAQAFVEATGIDTLAIFFGNVHGVFAQPDALDLDLLKKIAAKVTAYFSLHGGSGVPDEDVSAAIEIGGIVKVNVNSDLRIAFRESLEKSLAANDTVKAYDIFNPVIAAVQSVVEHKMDVFNSTGKADSLQKFFVEVSHSHQSSS